MTGGKKTGKKGFETEEIVRSYFLTAGFFAVRGVKLRHGGDDLTDIDLWLYERSATLARRRIVIDIKDNAQPKAAERLFFIKGLAEIIQVEATGVATSDGRPYLRELARRHNVLWIDNGDLQRLKSSQKLAVSSRITDEMLEDIISQVDSSRSSRNIRDAYWGVKSSVADRFGPSCANTAMNSVGYFSKLAVGAHPNSLPAQVFTRLSYFGAAIAAAALDFASGETALRPSAERFTNMTNAIRFGQDARGTEEKLRWAEAAVREYGPNGTGLADVIRSRFNEAINSIPAEGLAEIVVKMANSDRLFKAARDLEHAAFSSDLLTFDDLSLEGKTFLGAVLDFTQVDRKLFSQSWRSTQIPLTSVSVESSAATTRQGSETLESTKKLNSSDKNDGKLL